MIDPGSVITTIDSGGKNTIDMTPSDQPIIATVGDVGAMIDGGDGQVLATGTYLTVVGTSGGDTFFEQGSLDFTFVGADGDDRYVIDPGSVITTIDSGGKDTIDVSGSSESVIVDLGQTSGVVLTDSGGDQVVTQGRIENAVGTAGPDTLIGSGTDNILEGGPGDDTYITGGDRTEVVITPGSTDTVFDNGGFTILNLSKASMGVDIDLNRSNGVRQTIDDAGNGLILNGTIEGAVGSAFDDDLSGDTGPNLLFGGGGNDRLQGQSGDDVLVGGDGADDLQGGPDRDILVGGRGADQIHGGSGEDLLVGGHTAYDLDVSAFVAIQAEWTRTDRAYLDRVHAIRGETPGGLNGSVFLNASPTSLSSSPTVFDDNAVDTLTGAQQLDWFVIDVGDSLTGQIQFDEIVDLTTPSP